MEKRLSRINNTKATGMDGIQPKFLKMSTPVVASHVTNLINSTIETSVFSNALKCAEVTPIFKKSDSLNKANYRPVSMLPTISKLYERVLSD